MSVIDSTSRPPVQLYSLSDARTIDVTHRSTIGYGFGSAAVEVQRYQTFLTTPSARTVHGVDVRVRRVGGTAQSDVVVHLHATAGGRPTGIITV